MEHNTTTGGTPMEIKDAKIGTRVALMRSPGRTAGTIVGKVSHSRTSGPSNPARVRVQWDNAKVWPAPTMERVHRLEAIQ